LPLPEQPIIKQCDVSLFTGIRQPVPDNLMRAWRNFKDYLAAICCLLFKIFAPLTLVSSSVIKSPKSCYFNPKASIKIVNTKPT
jgi:hypothetical protein